MCLGRLEVQRSAVPSMMPQLVAHAEGQQTELEAALAAVSADHGSQCEFHASAYPLPKNAQLLQ